jgi:DNA-binding NarL/FixJ family response regulator
MVEASVRFACAEDALGLARDDRPDVWVVEALLRGVSGFELTRRLSARPAAPPVLMVTTLTGSWPLARAIRAGARGFLSWPAAVAVVAEALVCLSTGRAYWKTPERSKVDDALHASGIEDPTPRRFEALHLLLQGESDVGLARAMSVSRRSAAAYRRELDARLGLADDGVRACLVRAIGASCYVLPEGLERSPQNA